jgi:hypothetical protein
MTIAPPEAWWKRAVVTACCLAATGAVVPRTVVGREGAALFDGQRDVQEGLADAVAEGVMHDRGTAEFHTGSARFDGEWSLTRNQFAAMGLAQVVAAHPALRPRYLPALRRAADNLLRPETRRFGHEAWGRDALDGLDDDRGDAWLGYLALGLGAVRAVDPDFAHAALHDRIVASLARRLEAAPGGRLQTYPGEVFPCDIAAVVGALGQHARQTRTDRTALLARMAGLYRTDFVHGPSGYLVQSLDPATGRVVDGARGSGTALAAYFLSFADASLARQLGDSLARTGHARFVGFAGVREHASGVGGRGDIDSGPVVLGVSVSATGFALASARQRGDRTLYTGLFRTAALFGVPVSHGGGWRFVAGGPLGNALLLAMLTARPP